MSITIGNSRIKKILIGNTSINKVYVGENKIFSSSYIDTYVENILKLGGDEETVRKGYLNVPSKIEDTASVILFPSHSQKNKLYAMDNNNGNAIPIFFERDSIGTYIDGSDLKIAEKDFPRLDTGNYESYQPKILVEKESTNYLIKSKNDKFRMSLNNASVNYCDVLEDTKGWYAQKKGNDVGENISVYSNIFLTNEEYISKEFDNSKGYSQSMIFIADTDVADLRMSNLIETKQAALANKSIVKGLHRNSSTLRLSGFYSMPATIDAKIYYNYINLEEGEVYSSYIPTDGEIATRKADHLTINLLKDTKVYLKTTKEEKYLDKTAGIWNIEDDITESDGLLCLAILEKDAFDKDYFNAVKFNHFKEQLIEKGADEKLIDLGYSKIDADIKSQANILLFPSHAEDGVLYAMEPVVH